MLKNTFVHLKGISHEKERDLWHKGILTWQDYSRYQNPLLTLCQDGSEDSLLQASEDALNARDSDYFLNLLAPHDWYRIAATFPKDVLFLDIETTGLSLYYDTITLIGWSKEKSYGVYLAEGDPKEFLATIEEAKALVTFNGTLFDLKFIKQLFPGIVFPKLHLDLRFFCKRVGLTGGQKAIEELIRFSRKQSSRGLLGEAAPILWHQYMRGDMAALKRLIAYNHDDVEGMKAILDVCIQRYCQQEGIPAKIRPKKDLFGQNKAKLSFQEGQSLTIDPQAKNIITLQPYLGSTAPSMHYSVMAKLVPLDNFCVVGIDLVASEEKESGFCALRGAKAITTRLKTDAEMLNLIQAAQANLVSIDSPLSLPKGRTSVFDSDPKRAECGITRFCERELKRRGVSSYPCLIPSMQKLTARGIRLATKLRNLGIATIESYPGAAQDILKIPRKQAGLPYLMEGLHQFGLTGTFLERMVSHDELDAITAALVGHFFWTGMFEALGTDDEDPLIIPDLKASNPMWCQRLVIGLSGEMASGKTTLATHLACEGFVTTRFSAVLRQMLENEGQTPTRSALQDLGLHIAASGKQRDLGRLVAQNIQNSMKAVVDGLRFPMDHALLTEIFGPAFIHIHIDCDPDILLARANQRREDVSPDTARAHQVEQEIAQLGHLAHYRVSNNGNLSDFFQAIHNILEGKVCL